MIFDELGRPMSPYHTRNHGRRYSYYASNPGDRSKEPALRLPAGELDALVRTAFAELLKAPDQLRLSLPQLEATDLFALADHCADLEARLRSMNVAEARELLQTIGLTAKVGRDRVHASIASKELLALADVELDTDERIALHVPTTTISFGHEQRLRLEPATVSSTPRDARLIELLSRGFATRDRLAEMTAEDVSALPTTQYRHLERTARLAYLAPDIVRSIIEGRNPKALNARTLARLGSLPLCWSEQRTLLGFPPNSH